MGLRSWDPLRCTESPDRICSQHWVSERNGVRSVFAHLARVGLGARTSLFVYTPGWPSWLQLAACHAPRSFQLEYVRVFS
jgi:hypothetical protein